MPNPEPNPNPNPNEKVDRGRLVVTGHSRGGHGAWLFASLAPDKIRGVVAAAGWLKREQYGDANIAFRLDNSLSHMDPSLEGVLKGTNAENDVELYAAHLSNLPVLARVGSDDTSVPPYLTRKMARLVREYGGEVKLSELPGKNHWWWDTDATNDGGTMFDPEMRSFIDKALWSHPRGWKETFEVVTPNPAATHGRGGIRILQLVVPSNRGRVRVGRVCETGAEKRACTWRLETRNVCRIRVVGGLDGGMQEARRIEVR